MQDFRSYGDEYIADVDLNTQFEYVFVPSMIAAPNFCDDLNIIKFFNMRNKDYVASIYFNTDKGVCKVSSKIKTKSTSGLTLDEGLFIPYISLVGLKIETISNAIPTQNSHKD